MLQNTGYRIQNTGYRIQDTEHKIQNTGYRTQDTEYRIYNARHRIRDSTEYNILCTDNKRVCKGLLVYFVGYGLNRFHLPYQVFDAILDTIISLRGTIHPEQTDNIDRQHVKR